MSKTLSGLTERQREKPHSIVRHRHTSMSVLERSFARGGLEEIEYWDGNGVLDEALSGNAKRDYTSSLLQYLIENRRQGFWSHDADRWEAILRKLWDGGAHRHTDKYDRWIHGMAGHWLFDVMLDAGASPYGSSVFKSDAATSLLDEIALHELYYEEGRPSPFFGSSDMDPELLRQQVDRCLEFSDVSPTALSGILATVIHRGVGRLNQEPWRRWRDKLLERGADPMQSHAYAIASLGFAGPGPTSIPRYDLLQIDRNIDMAQPPTDAEIQLSLAERTKRDQRWIASSTEWIDALVPSIRAHVAKDPHCVLDANTWGRILVQPNGVDLCRRLLDAGVQPPWHAQDSSFRIVDILNSHYREPGRLARVVQLLETHGSGVCPVWAETTLVNYSRSRTVNDFRLLPKFDDRVSDYTPRRKKTSSFYAQEFEALSHEEITHLLKLVHWTPGQELSSRLSEIIARRPFLPGVDGIDADIELLVSNGMLKQALSPGAEGATELHRSDWVRYTQWFDGWMENDAVFAKVIATDPQLHWPLLSLAVQMAARNQSSPEIRHKWFARLATDFPQNAEPVLTKIFSGLANAPDAWIRDNRETATHDLLAFGALATPDQLADLANKTFNLAGSSGPERQAELIRFLADVGVNLKTQGAALIEIELLRELSDNQSPARTDLYKPAILAILEGGADVSSLDLGRSSRPLHEFVRITASRLALEASTQTHGAAPRSRRF